MYHLNLKYSVTLLSAGRWIIYRGMLSGLLAPTLTTHLIYFPTLRAQHLKLCTLWLSVIVPTLLVLFIYHKPFCRVSIVQCLWYHLTDRWNIMVRNTFCQLDWQTSPLIPWYFSSLTLKSVTVIELNCYTVSNSTKHNHRTILTILTRSFIKKIYADIQGEWGFGLFFFSNHPAAMQCSHWTFALFIIILIPCILLASQNMVPTLPIMQLHHWQFGLWFWVRYVDGS